MSEKPDPKKGPAANAPQTFSRDPLDTPTKFKPYEPKPKSWWWVGTFPGGPQNVSCSFLTFPAFRGMWEQDIQDGSRSVVNYMGAVIALDDEEVAKIREHLGYEMVIERSSGSKDDAHGVVTEYKIKTLRGADGAHNRWIRDDEALRGAKPLGAYVYMKRVNGAHEWPKLAGFLRSELKEGVGLVWSDTSLFSMEKFPLPVMVPESAPV